jgi:hypothetical protein
VEQQDFSPAALPPESAATMPIQALVPDVHTPYYSYEVF